MRRRLVVAVLMVLAASVLAAVVPPVDRAGAQSPSVLVSNLGVASTDLQSFGRDLAQAFTTGGNVLGYTVDSVDVRFFRLSDNQVFASKLTATIRADSGGAPGAAVATLINPAFESVTSGDGRVLSFAAPSGGIELAGSTTYWLVMDSDGTHQGNNQFRMTGVDGEDAGGASGFSIADTSRFRSATSTGVWDGPAPTLMFRINGRVCPCTTSVGSSVLVTHGESVNADGRIEVWGGGTFTVTVTLGSVDADGEWLDIRAPIAKLGIVKVGDTTYSTPERQVHTRVTQTSNQAGLEVTFQAVDDSTQHANVPVLVHFQASQGKTVLPVVVNRDPRVSSVDFVQIGGRDVCATPPTGGCFDHSRYAGGGDTFNLAEGVAPDTSVAKAATSYTLRLSDRPAPGATVRVTPRQAEMSGGGDLRFFPSEAAWTHDNWQEERSIHVMSAHDGDVEDAVFRIEHQFNEHFSGDTAAGSSLVIHGTVADDDEVALVIKNSAGVTVPPNDAAADLVLRRGAETSYTVELSHSPPSPVTAWVRTFDADKTTKSPVGVSAGGSFTEDIWVGLPTDAVNARQTGFRFDSTN